MKAFNVSEKTYYRWFFSIRLVWILTFGYLLSELLDVVLDHTEIGALIKSFAAMANPPTRPNSPENLSAFVLVFRSIGLVMIAVTLIHIFREKEDEVFEFDIDLAKKTIWVYGVGIAMFSISLIERPMNIYGYSRINSYIVYKVFYMAAWIYLIHQILVVNASIKNLIRRKIHV